MSTNFYCTMPINGNNCKWVNNNYSNRENETPTKAENAKIKHLENVYPYGYIVWTAVFSISIYGAPLAHGASFLDTSQFSLQASGEVNYDYIVTNSIKSLLIGSRCFSNAHTLNIFEPIWPMLQNLSKTMMVRFHLENLLKCEFERF